MIYEAENVSLIARVPKTTKRLLDVGCGTGALGQRIKEELNCEVVGITYSEAEAKLARDRVDEVVVSDLNNLGAVGAGLFDCIVCSHVLEHLYRPDEILLTLRRELSDDGTLIVALPNPLHWRQRLEFLLGRFRYTDGGLMDRTHYRFYDWFTAQELISNSGYSILNAKADGGFPLSRFLSFIGIGLDRVALKFSPGLFAVQFVFVCRRAGD